MPGIGGISIATNLLANSVTLNLNRNQGALLTSVTRLSSGLRVNTAADDPSGLAIATRLESQSSGFDAGSRNVQDANNAATLADGALGTETDILQRIRDLAVQASSDFTSNTDKLNLQAEVSQLLLEVNRISATTNFNGSFLLDGSHQGFTPQISFNAIVNSNGVLGASSATPGQNNLLVASLTYSATNNSSVDGTIAVQVAQLTATQQGIIFQFLSTATNGFQVVCVATVAANGAAITFTYDGVQLTSGISVGTVDVGTTSFVKITQFVSAASNPSAPAFTIQSGANQGAVIQVGFQATNTQILRISNVNVAGSIGTGSGTLAAEDAIGQVDYALNQVLNNRALLGAVVVRLNDEENSNNIASVNLTAAASNILDLNIGQETTNYTKLQILVSVGTAVLVQSNVNAQSVVSLFR